MFPLPLLDLAGDPLGASGLGGGSDGPASSGVGTNQPTLQGGVNIQRTATAPASSTGYLGAAAVLGLVVVAGFWFFRR